MTAPPSSAPAVAGVERKTAARDVHYALIEEYALRDDSLTNHAVRSLLERLAVDDAAIAREQRLRSALQSIESTIGCSGEAAVEMKRIARAALEQP